jgi:hypothetical protein
MHIIPHNLLSDERMLAHSCCLTPPPTGQEQVPQDEVHGGWCDKFMRGLGHRLLVNFGLLDRCLLMMYLFIYFVQNSNYIVKMWHLFLYHDSSYVWDLVPAQLVIISRPGFGPLKPGCDRSGIRAILTVGRNLDKTGQPLLTYLCYSDSF